MNYLRYLHEKRAVQELHRRVHSVIILQVKERPLPPFPTQGRQNITAEEPVVVEVPPSVPPREEELGELPPLPFREEAVPAGHSEARVRRLEELLAGLSRVEQERVQGRSQNVEVIRSPLEQRRGALAQSINLEEEEEEVARIDEDIAREATARREREKRKTRLCYPKII